MNWPYLLGSRQRWVTALLSAAFGLAVVFGAVTIPIVLYYTPGCEPALCVPMAPRLHVLPLAIGILITAVAWHGASRLSAMSVIAGLALGVAGVMLGGAFEVSVIPQLDPYFALQYRLYAFGFLALISFISAALVAREFSGTGSSGGPAFWAMPLGAVLLVAAISSIADSRVIGLAALGALTAGVLLGPRIDRTRVVTTLGHMRVAGVLTALVVVTFASRAFFGLQTLAGTGPGMAFAIGSDDGDSYFTLATRLAADPTSLVDILAGIAFPPAYTIFLSLVLAATNGNLAAVVIAQAALAALATYLVFQIARCVMPATIALGAAGLFAFDMNLIQNASTLTAEALLIPATLGAIYLAARYTAAGRVRWLIGAATLLGLCFVTRNVVAFPLCVAVLGWLSIMHRREPMVIVRDSAIIVAAVIAFSSPIAFATATQHGAPRFTTQLAGLAWTFEGGPGYTISNRELLDRGIDPFADPLGSLARFIADPVPVVVFYLSAGPQRVSTLFYFANPGASDPLVIVNDAFFPNAFGETVRILRFVALLAALGFVISTRHWYRAPVTGLLIAFFVLYVAVFVFLFPPYHAFRYRIPVEPIRFIAEAGGLALIIRATATAWTSRPLHR